MLLGNEQRFSIEDEAKTQVLLPKQLRITFSKARTQHESMRCLNVTGLDPSLLQSKEELTLVSRLKSEVLKQDQGHAYKPP